MTYTHTTKPKVRTFNLAALLVMFEDIHIASTTLFKKLKRKMTLRILVWNNIVHIELEFVQLFDASPSQSLQI